MTLNETQNYLKRLSYAIKRRRLELNLTQKKLAEKIGIGLSTFRKFERTGKISLEQFVKLLFVLQFSLDFIINLENDRKYDTIDEILGKANFNIRKRGKKNV